MPRKKTQINFWPNSFQVKLSVKIKKTEKLKEFYLAEYFFAHSEEDFWDFKVPSFIQQKTPSFLNFFFNFYEAATPFSIILKKGIWVGGIIIVIILVIIFGLTKNLQNKRYPLYI